MDYITPILLLTVTAHLLLGGFVFTRNRTSVVHRAVLLECVLFALWALGCMAIWSPAFYADALLWGRLVHSLTAFVVAGFVNLCILYPDGRTTTPVAARAGVWALATFMSALVVFTPDLLPVARLVNGEMHSRYGPLRGAYFGYVVLCLALGLCFLWSRYRRSRGVRRLQIQYFFLGLLLTALLNQPSDVIAPLLGYHSFAWLGPVWSLAFAGTVAHAIVRYRMMGIRLFVGKGVAYFVAVLMAGGLFWGILSVAKLLMGHVSVTAASLLGLALALLFQPLHSRILARVSRYFHRPGYDYQSVVRSASRTLAATLDLDRALDYVLTAIVQALPVEHTTVLVLDRPAQLFRVRARQSQWGGEEDYPEGDGLHPGGPLVAHLEATQEPVVREELERRLAPEVAEPIAAEMAAFKADVAVPLYSGQVLLAVVLVGSKLSGDLFTGQDLDLLATLGSEAGAAIANAQLHQEAMQAEKLATLGALAAGIAHEVKNPLVAMRTFGELLPEKHDDPEFRELFATLVLGEVDRINQLIEQLLNYARPTPPRLEPVDLNAILRATLQLVSYDISRQRIEVRESYAPDLPPVDGDASQLKQVFLNIILNAIQVMPAEGLLRITTSVHGPLRDRPGGAPLPGAGGMVEVCVANTGPAIPVENQERIFEPFFSGRKGGTGLGLSICKRIVTSHHGQIRASTTEDGLTAFTVRLPVAGAGEPEAVPAETVPEPAALAGAGSMRG